jgi:hypothetical protein
MILFFNQNTVLYIDTMIKYEQEHIRIILRKHLMISSCQQIFEWFMGVIERDEHQNFQLSR